MVAGCAADIAGRIPGCQRIPAPGADHLLPLRAPAMIAELAGQLASEGGVSAQPGEGFRSAGWYPASGSGQRASVPRLEARMPAGPMP